MYLFVICHLYIVLIYFNRLSLSSKTVKMLMLTLRQERSTLQRVKKAIREENNRERFHMRSLPQREKNKQREKWKAASSACRERKKMANAVLDLTPLSMEDIPPVLVKDKPIHTFSLPI